VVLWPNCYACVAMLSSTNMKSPLFRIRLIRNTLFANIRGVYYMEAAHLGTNFSNKDHTGALLESGEWIGPHTLIGIGL
jgi:hypothetical protein